MCILVVDILVVGTSRSCNKRVVCMVGSGVVRSNNIVRFDIVRFDIVRSL